MLRGVVDDDLFLPSSIFMTFTHKQFVRIHSESFSCCEKHLRCRYLY
jgi:hypothetical protein